MTKVCKDYGMMIRTITDRPVPGKGNYNKQMFFAEMKKEYPPEEGWEQVQMIFTGQQPEGYTIGVLLNQYELVPDDAPVARAKSK